MPEYDAPADFAVVRVYGDEAPVVVACLRCDWQSGKGARAFLLGPNGPARMHDRDKHASDASTSQPDEPTQGPAT